MLAQIKQKWIFKANLLVSENGQDYDIAGYVTNTNIIIISDCSLILI